MQMEFLKFCQGFIWKIFRALRKNCQTISLKNSSVNPKKSLFKMVGRISEETIKKCRKKFWKGLLEGSLERIPQKSSEGEILKTTQEEPFQEIPKGTLE